MNSLGFDGVVLVAAGSDKLSLGEVITQRFSTNEVVPTAGPGAIAIEIRDGDEELEQVVSRINDDETMRVSEYERARATGGDCNVPIGTYTTNSSKSLTLTGMIVSQTDYAC